MKLSAKRQAPASMLSLAFALAFALSAAPGSTAWADSIWSDPLRTAKDISGGPAKSMTGMEGCASSAPLPVPLSLLDAVKRALCSNPRTRQAWANVKIQAAAVGIGRAAYLPTLNAGGSVARVHKDTSIPGFPEFDSTLDTRSTDVNLSLSWVLFDFGLRAANLESARQLLDAADATQDDTLQTVFFDTVQAFYKAQAALALLAALDDAQRAARTTYEATAAKYCAGAGVLADKLQANTSYAQAVLKRSQANGELQSAFGALAIDMGMAPDTPLQLAPMPDQVPRAPLFQRAIDAMIAEAVKVHPKILAAKAQLKAAQAQVDAERAGGRPTLSLIAVGDRSNTPIDQVSSKEIVSSRSIGIQISIPLTDGFSRTYKIRGAQAQAESKAADLATVEQQVALEVWNSEQALRTESENVQTTAVLLRSAAQSLEVARGRYKAGVGNILELLKAQSDAADAQQQRVLALTRWQTARLRLAASLGRLRMDGI